MDIFLFNTLLDVLMIVAIMGLWWMWFKQSAQRKKVELMLIQASDELQQATALLDKVMAQLPEMQQQEKEHLHSQVMLKEKDMQDKVSIQKRSVPAVPVQHSQHVSTQPKQAEQARGQVPVRKYSSAKQHDGASQSAQIMRLNREGLSMETIAKQLEMPIAQVRLMLLLQAPKV